MIYSIDDRRKVLAVREKEDLTLAEVAERFCVGIATVVRWLGRLEPQRMRVKLATRIDRIALAWDVREHPDAYQKEHAKRLSLNSCPPVPQTSTPSKTNGPILNTFAVPYFVPSLTSSESNHFI